MRESVHKNALEYQEMSGYVHLPKDVIRTLEQMEISDLTIIHNDIAFPKSKQQEIDGILEALLYLDMKPLERREAELFYRGAGDLHIENPEKYGDLSEAQKEALERSRKYEVEEKTMDSKEGKEISDKRLEKLLHRQKQQEMSQSQEM